MTKKLFSILTVVVFGLILVFTGMFALAGNNSSGFTSYANAMKSDKPAVILFYADWCTYCRRFIPKFNTAASTYADKFNFVKVNVDSSDKNKALSNQYNVRGIPVVYIVNPKNKSKKQISDYAYSSVKALELELGNYYNYRR